MIRRANENELDEIYLMGFDAWSESRPAETYLKACAASAKYREGAWYVLEENGRLSSSLIVYRLTERGEGAFGLGSIATPRAERRRGRAALLIRGVLDLLDRQGAGTVYLHSDISPAFYERLGFRALPAGLQKSPTSVCMLKCAAGAFDALLRSPGFRAPDYF